MRRRRKLIFSLQQQQKEAFEGGRIHSTKNNNSLGHISSFPFIR